LAGVSTAIAAIAVATPFRRQQCNQISNRCLEMFKKIITLLIVTILFLFTFFNLILDAPHKSQQRYVKIRENAAGYIGIIMCLKDRSSSYV
jgi:hypothetical protein